MYGNDKFQASEISGYLPSSNMGYFNPQYQLYPYSYSLQNPNANNINNNGYAYDNVLIGVISILLLLLICLVCFGIYLMVGAGCYVFGKSHSNNNHATNFIHDKDKDQEFHVKL